MLTIETYPAATDLTTLAKVKAAGRSVLTNAADADLSDLIARVSAAIVNYCNREFARVDCLETVPGFGSTNLTVSRRPIVSVALISFQGLDAPVTDYTVENAGAGLIFRAAEWTPTLNVGYRLTRYVIPNGERPDWWVRYIGGWLMPGDDLLASATISAAASDNSYNDSASGFSALLKPGDRILASGWTTAANNGWSTVVSATAGKVVVSGRTLSNEAAAAGNRSLQLRNLPVDVEQAAIEAVIDWYQNGPRNRRVTQRKVGDTQLTYAAEANANALPDSVQSKLANFCDVAVV